MPWKETCPMKQRVAMIGDWIKDESSIAELSRIYGVSRVTIYICLERFEVEGPAGIREHSRAPHRHPNAVPEEMVTVIVAERLNHPTWGPKKIQKASPSGQNPRSPFSTSSCPFSTAIWTGMRKYISSPQRLA